MTTKGTVLITGAAGGIGSVLVEAYLQAGWRVAATDLEDRCAGLEQKIMRHGQAFEYTIIPADLQQPAEIERLFDRLDKHGWLVNTLINNAGFGITKKLTDLTVAEWDSVLNVNLRAAFLCAKETAARLRKTGSSGAIVNISSTRAIMSEPNTEAYAASKGGISALTHALAASLGPDGIRVNSISPGWIEIGNYEALREADHNQHPAGRVGRPDDIARACLYLTDPGNDFVTGTDLIIDGGMTRKMIYEP
ncbi:SDR family NAD(P)-dependent oxidoreductase [Paenibacillus tarimensis]|uniref:SDR family NAD(P)-dependent oxidoreductase n=1 Tax=Paenibacillus tarimensis TaxID=416012 RepID=UPI001F31539F|nr:SDR family oxidoreductase [Paenibacillus tarimensis]MCF2942719.1 SDR family oxidoreductase [Paenibacillus tarimensis]